MIGVILLMGLVTKNAILLVDGALQNLRAGDTMDDRAAEGGPAAPAAHLDDLGGDGHRHGAHRARHAGWAREFRAPMAIAVIGGVITSTFLTLLVVPVVFAFFEKLTPKAFRPKVSEEAHEPAEEEAVAEPKPSLH